MNWDAPGTINSSVSSTGIAVMATAQKKLVTKKADDEAWDAIFDSLTIENEPPLEYVRNVIIYTKDGTYIKVSPRHFAEIIEHEKHLGPEHSEIKSCRMNINFPKLKADVNEWTARMLAALDQVPYAEKKRAVARRTAAKPAAKKPKTKPRAKSTGSRRRD